MHIEDFDQTVSYVKELLEDSIKRQMVSDVPVCTFLSGGLDSSIVTYYAANYYKEKNLGKLHTYSVDYVDNDKNFVKSDFQPNSDKYYINIMTKTLKTEHHNIVIDTPELADTLKDAMIARDLPGMADIDSSLLLFCKEVKKNHTVALTGECADEIFGGYPWFFRQDSLKAKTFPWSLGINERQFVLNKELSDKINLKEYIDYRYKASLKEVPSFKNDTEEETRIRNITYLNMQWFMQTLLDRQDRMSMYNGFESRVPFCDYRIVEYLWNIPWDMKSLNGREKGLLRYSVRDILPKEIMSRKKSPYPKTHNPTYLKKVKGMLSDIISNNNSPVLNVVDKKFAKDLIDTDGASFSRPWFGQLMTGPQLMAYLIQVNMWLEKYTPKIIL